MAKSTIRSTAAFSFFVASSVFLGDCSFAFAPTALIGRYSKPRPLQSVPDPLDVLTSGLASIFRLPGGVTVIEEASKLPEEGRPQLKRLYDVENSRSCRAVREKITELDLVVETVIPAAANSRVFTDSNYKYALPPDATIPRLVLVDGGQELTLSGADDILSYFEGKYSLPNPTDDSTAKSQIIMFAREAGGYLAIFVRIGRGMMVSPAGGPAAPRPEKPLALYSYEGNQFCRLVREVLTELDLPFELRSVGKESPRLRELAAATGGSTQCPYLVDPNTDTAMAESTDIIRYLYKTYALWTPPNELLQWASDVILPIAKPLFAQLAPIQAGSNQDKATYDKKIAECVEKIKQNAQENAVVIYTYSLSPFSSETRAVLTNLGIEFEEISLGAEWLPGFLSEGGAEMRAALFEMTGQSSLPHIFIGGESIGGLFSGTPGLIPALEQGILMDKVAAAMKKSSNRVSAKGLSLDTDLQEAGAFE